jgi:hypothetical protein
MPGTIPDKVQATGGPTQGLPRVVQDDRASQLPVDAMLFFRLAVTVLVRGVQVDVGARQ